MSERGTLIFFCGKMGAGKSTLARRLAEEDGAILLSEDAWLAALYPEEIREFADYLKYSARLKGVLTDHVRSVLRSGRSVVMDFPGNTRNQRGWFREILSGEDSGEGDLPHRLYYLRSSDEACLRRLAKRREEEPERAHFDTEEVFRHVTGFFQEPGDDEGFEVVIVDMESA